MSAEMRNLVLSYPDIAERLCERPLNHARPEQWNGYIPPAYWQEKENDSPRRAALISIYREAYERLQSESQRGANDARR